MAENAPTHAHRKALLKKVCCILSKLLNLLHHVRKVVENFAVNTRLTYCNVCFIFTIPPKQILGSLLPTRISRCLRDSKDSLGVPKFQCSSPLPVLKELLVHIHSHKNIFHPQDQDRDHMYQYNLEVVPKNNS